MTEIKIVSFLVLSLFPCQKNQFVGKCLCANCFYLLHDVLISPSLAFSFTGISFWTFGEVHSTQVRRMSQSNTGVSGKLLLGVGVGLAAVGGASYYLYQRFKPDVMPTKWRRVGQVNRINVFPVKSCAPLQIKATDELSTDLLGLRLEGVRDRSLMLVDLDDKFVTARVYPKLVLIKPKLVSPTRIIFSAPGMPELELDFATLAEEAPGKDIHTAVWGVKVDAMLCGPRFDAWFSEFVLGEEEGLKLVHYPYPKPVRATNPRLSKQPFLKQEDSGTFVDATSYMMMNLASVDELNTRLKRPVDSLQFRGNFDLKMDVNEPYAEDKWQWVRIGEQAVFRVVAPCTRCIFPNINVETAERDPDSEPFKTLKTYRLFNYASPALGIHLGVRQPGSVKLNDPVYVEDN